ncbi:FecCD family ABC transporter permease [Zhihengliuella flava]|uniref:Iron complex transport system permease protein n=1 Tax=Zhihengliuella flava TaxID=1285193 RepID=A0A931GMC7_9MICC|nr:iron chelate uptake ABC transporter family permease subunit [Zhihengliuella flava]MBG6085294.1 iron complex transport system permease protein [Zhihengliuella flava]
MTEAVAPSRRTPSRTVRVGFAGVLALALVASVFASLAVGSNPLPLSEVWAALTGQGTAEGHYVIWEQRIPRTLAGLLAGVALGVAGALVQAFTRNPLADPGILGVNAGAALFVTLGIAFWGATTASTYGWLACVGALVVTAAVYLIGSSRTGPASPVQLTVVGVAVGAVLSGITTAIVLTHPETFDKTRGWNAGSLLERGLDVSLPLLPLLAIGLVCAACAVPGLNSTVLGSDVARSQGVNVARLQILVLLAVTFLAGAATALAGPITFVGLMIPHLVRWSLGTDQRVIFLGSVLAAPVLMLAADVLGRVIIMPSEMPVGIVTAFVGAPVLIALVRRSQASAL